jgi:hypothetical protein
MTCMNGLTIRKHSVNFVHVITLTTVTLAEKFY